MNPIARRVIGSIVLLVLLLAAFGNHARAAAALEPALPAGQGEGASDSATAPAGHTPIMVQKSLPQDRQAEAANILIIQQSLPWDSYADMEVLSQLGFTYDVVDMSDVPYVTLSSYKVVLIANDQPQEFYDAYAQNATTIENYVQGGGVLIFFAADYGWSGGLLNTKLPGGVTMMGDHYETNNYVATPGHPIASGALSDNVALVDSDLVSNYCSHGYFTSLVAGAKVVFKDQHAHPTLIDYNLGLGRVIASTNTWEHGYNYGRLFALKALDDVFLTAFAGQGGWVGANIGAVISGSSTINGNDISIRQKGGDIWSTADALHFVYQRAGADQSFVAKLTAWNPGGVTGAKTGLMVRSSLDPGAPEFTIHVTGPDKAIKLKWRTSQGWSTAFANGPSSSNLPLWLKVTKSGSTVTGYYSTDGSNWIQLGAGQTLDGIGNSYLLGMATASNSQSVEATAAYQLVANSRPTITSFSPAAGAAGTVVTVNGSNFVGVTSVKFNGLAASFNVISATQLQATVPNGATTGKITVATASGSATSVVDFLVPGGALDAVYLSTVTDGTVGGVAFAKADILKYTRTTNTWEMVFDASDVGITTANTTAFTFLPGGGLLLSFAASTILPGLGTVTPQDVVQFLPTQLGANTQGSFQWYFDGSDVGLTTSAEKIDSLGFFMTAVGSRRIRISTTGTASVINENGVAMTAENEDVLAFVVEKVGADTKGRWAAQLNFDGTGIPGLAVENVNGYSYDPMRGEYYVTILGGFNLGNGQAVGNGKSVVKMTPNPSAPGGWTPSIVKWLANGVVFSSTLDGIELVR